IGALLLANVEIFLGINLYKLFTEERNKKFLKSTFGTYLAPELIEEMVDNKEPPKLGGEARQVTAYFTDIQGFSSFAEKLTAEQLVELLNEYLSEMTEILISERGTLDKYIGDAIVAVFGAPMDLPDHGVRACRVAVKMQERQDALCRKWSEEKQDPHEPNRNVKNLPEEEWAPGDKWPKLVHDMKTRIGINSGYIVVGNMGSSTRMNYTMMGDAVNLAARLEAGSKQFGIYSMVSEYTLDELFEDKEGGEHRVADHVEARFIDSITVVGKSEPVKVYEICAMKGELTEQEQELFDIFNQSMEHYRHMEWDKAIAGFEKALKIERVPEGKTTPSQMFIERCREFKESPPVPKGEVWDGVYRMTRK
ncbi:MAG: adenylate/guanylate cyclase domain-containing protein, partial [Verrucomicrobiota bacterium]